jgi:chloramphenicol-sensitive protein RarD
VPILLSGGGGALLNAAKSKRALLIYGGASLAVAMNWFIYVWAVGAGFIVQTALGYYINPLVTVLLGVLVFHEKLRPAQWTALGLAALGVLYLAISFGTPPWVALGLAVSFGIYGMLKKTAPLEALQGLALETSILFLPALAYLLYVERAGHGQFLHTGTRATLLMIAAGPVTTLPLLLFAVGVKRIPLSLMGMLQYINPTIQFLIGVFVYKEPFTRSQFAGFACVWGALVLFAGEGYVAISSSAGQTVDSGGSDGPEEDRGGTN